MSRGQKFQHHPAPKKGYCFNLLLCKYITKKFLRQPFSYVFFTCCHRQVTHPPKTKKMVSFSAKELPTKLNLHEKLFLNNIEDFSPIFFILNFKSFKGYEMIFRKLLKAKVKQLIKSCQII